MMKGQEHERMGINSWIDLLSGQSHSLLSQPTVRRPNTHPAPETHAPHADSSSSPSILLLQQQERHGTS